jgi:hypothetical protein
MIDSAATSHFCPDRAKFKTYTPIKLIPIYAADGHTFEVIGRGDVQTELPNGRYSTKTTLQDALYAPAMAFTLISASRLDRAGYSLTIGNGSCTIKSPSQQVIGRVPMSGGSYKIPARNSAEAMSANTSGENKVKTKEVNASGGLPGKAAPAGESKAMAVEVNVSGGKKARFMSGENKGKATSANPSGGNPNKAVEALGSAKAVEAAHATKTKFTLSKLHRCLGHMSPAAARDIVRLGMVKGIDLDTRG